ncbi:MAG: tetratricopeptide repeat protein [Armatimonadetes bacterium]|nr:tetratricopeptide repeat protein [Armatimonadota bacterium]
MDEHEARPEPGGIGPSAPNSPLEGKVGERSEPGEGERYKDQWNQVLKLAQSLESAHDGVVRQALEEALDAKLKALRAQTNLADPKAAKHPRLARALTALDFAVPEPEPEPELPEIPLAAEPADPEQVAQAEALLRQARVHSMRGDHNGARSLLEQAAKVAPQSGAVLEALGDELQAQGKKRPAIEMYKRAIALSPGNVGLEKKHADLVFSAFAASQVYVSSASQAEMAASAKAAVVMSIILPGLGQVVTGRFVAGALCLILWLGAWVVAGVMGFGNLGAAMTGKPFNGQPPNYMIFLPVGLALLFHLYAIVDANAASKQQARKKVDHPKPPTNLPFE